MKTGIVLIADTTSDPLMEEDYSETSKTSSANETTILSVGRSISLKIVLYYAKIKSSFISNSYLHQDRVYCN